MTATPEQLVQAATAAAFRVHSIGLTLGDVIECRPCGEQFPSRRQWFAHRETALAEAALAAVRSALTSSDADVSLAMATAVGAKLGYEVHAAATAALAVESSVHLVDDSAAAHTLARLADRWRRAASWMSEAVAREPTIQPWQLAVTRMTIYRSGGRRGFSSRAVIFDETAEWAPRHRSSDLLAGPVDAPEGLSDA